MLETLRARRAEILAILDKYGATDVRVFGSVARGEDDETSDIDFVVRYTRPRSLFDEVDLVDELGALLGRPVDVVGEDSLRPRVRRRIDQDAVAL